MERLEAGIGDAGEDFLSGLGRGVTLEHDNHWKVRSENYEKKAR
jgi:hypothetical protein